MARAARWTAAFGAAAVLLGVGTPVPAAPVHASEAPTQERLSPDALDALASAGSELATGTPVLHPSVPLGYRAQPAAPSSPATAPVAATRSRVAAHEPAASTSSPVAPAPTPTHAPHAPAPTGGSVLPLPVLVGRSTQVVTVVAPSPGSTRAVVTAWQLGTGGWTAAVGPVPALIGEQGVGRASEDRRVTPQGTFTLTEGFGRAGNPGTRLRYRQINPSDYWVSDRHSPLYNTFYECSTACPFDPSAGERLWDAGASYEHALVIDYNRWPAVSGNGSAFFLHVTNGAPTYGCVAIDDGSLTAIMRWLDPAARPLISIGLG